MTMEVLRNRILSAQVAAMTRMNEARTRTKDALTRLARGERGQTPTEYLMIVGFMAVVIVVVFVFWYWQNVQSQAKAWSNNVQRAVGGSDVK